MDEDKQANVQVEKLRARAVSFSRDVCFSRVLSCPNGVPQVDIHCYTRADDTEAAKEYFGENSGGIPIRYTAVLNFAFWWWCYLIFLLAKFSDVRLLLCEIHNIGWLLCLDCFTQGIQRPR